MKNITGTSSACIICSSQHLICQILSEYLLASEECNGHYLTCRTLSGKSSSCYYT
jgi:hypothetical protein